MTTNTSSLYESREDKVKRLFYDSHQAHAKSEEFIYAKAQELFKQWLELEIPKLQELIAMSYEEFDRSHDDEVVRVREQLYGLVAYCDDRAKGKRKYNQLSDCRVVARAGIRQHAWVQQLLKLKRDESECTRSIQNLANYLRAPEHHFPILSEEHRGRIISYYLEDSDPQNFDERMKRYFDSTLVGEEIKNESNRTAIYTYIIYKMSSDWQSSTGIKGLLTRDNTGWQDKLCREMGADRYAVIWRSCVISDYDERMKNSLQELIDGEGFFPYYFIRGGQARYKAEVIAFVARKFPRGAEALKEWERVREEWKRYDPCWFCWDWDEYMDEDKSGKERYADNLFLIRKMERLDAPFSDSCFELYGKQASQKNTVAFIHLKLPKSAEEQKHDEQMNKIIEIWQQKKNIILQGAPGTGKTYSTAELAVRMIENEGNDAAYSSRSEWMEAYHRLLDAGCIRFVTFHQSLDYEDFVVGIRPSIDEQRGIVYEVQDGVFKQICSEAEQCPEQPYVLIIDEINRGNVSKVFGELITLLEADKRRGEPNELSLSLPHSKPSDPPFSVPRNLYILGTMNTTDRSVGTLDYALRRRFAFITCPAKREQIERYYQGKSNGDLKRKALELFDSVEAFLGKKNLEFDLEDLMVGHSYFMAESLDCLNDKLEYEIIPLIREYEKDGLINVSSTELSEKIVEWKKLFTAETP